MKTSWQKAPVGTLISVISLCSLGIVILPAKAYGENVDSTAIESTQFDSQACGSDSVEPSVSNTEKWGPDSEHNVAFTMALVAESQGMSYELTCNQNAVRTDAEQSDGVTQGYDSPAPDNNLSPNSNSSSNALCDDTNEGADEISPIDSNAVTVGCNSTNMANQPENKPETTAHISEWVPDDSGSYSWFDEHGQQVLSGWVTTSVSLDNVETGTMHRYWIDPETGAAALAKIVTTDSGNTVYATANGWIATGKHTTETGGIYLADEFGYLDIGNSEGWVVTDRYDGVMQRYHIGSGLSVSTGDFQALMDGALLWFHGDVEFGYVARGKYVESSTGRIFLADDAGRLEEGNPEGWVVTDRYDGTMQRYHVGSDHSVDRDTFSAKMDGITKQFHGDVEFGYVARGKYVESSTGRIFLADDAGRLEEGNPEGWVVTDRYDGVWRRYQVDKDGLFIKTGQFFAPMDGINRLFYASPTSGYVSQGKFIVDRALYLADVSSGVIQSGNSEGWVVSKDFDGVWRRYHLAEDYSVETGLFSALMDGIAEWFYGTISTGFVAQGKYTDPQTKRMYLANHSDGRLEKPNSEGWVVTTAYDGVWRRYHLNSDHAVDTGLFEALMDGKPCLFISEDGQGFVLCNGGTWVLDGQYRGLYYHADNSGKLQLDSSYSNKVSLYAKWMADIALDDTHGYDQLYREGEFGDYDCSSLTVAALNVAGIDTAWAWSTRDMRPALTSTSFEWITDLSDIQFGDILLSEGHHAAVCRL